MLPLLAATALLAGCGGGGSAHRGRTVTVPSYAGFPPMTITGTYDPAECTADSDAFAREGRLFALHSGAAAAYSADTYYIDLRRIWADFEARDCDPATLGSVLHARLTPGLRSALVGNLPHDMAQTVREGLTVRSPSKGS